MKFQPNHLQTDTNSIINKNEKENKLRTLLAPKLLKFKKKILKLLTFDLSMIIILFDSSI